jgi:hypothetical protein
MNNGKMNEKKRHRREKHDVRREGKISEMKPSWRKIADIYLTPRTTSPICT